MKVVVTNGKITKSTLDSVGYDLYYNGAEPVTIPRGEYRVLGTGVTTEMHGVFALMLDRSGLAVNGVSRRAGVIDADYRGEWKVILHNEGYMPFTVNPGDRIAQAVFLPMYPIHVTALNNGVVEIKDEQRTGGLGSTGK